MNLLIMSLILSSASFSTGAKVRERFNDSPPKDCDCIMQILGFDGYDETAVLMFEDLKKISGFYPANCSMLISPMMGAGRLINESSYDGILGYIQRNRITYSVYLVRIDEIPLRVGVIGPPVASSSGMILMKQDEGKCIRKDFITIIMNFDLITYSYIFTAMIVCSILTHMIRQRIVYENHRPQYPHTHPPRIEINMMKYLDILWTFLCASCGQYWYQGKENSQKLIYAGFLIATVWLFFFIGRNLISSDLVIIIEEPHPESVNDLLSSDFDHLEVQIFAYLQLNTLIQEEHRLKELRDRINRKESNLIKEQSIKTVQHCLGSIGSGKAVILLEEYILQSLRPYICTSDPKAGSKLHIPQVRIAEGHGYVIFSDSTPPRLLKYLDYRFRTALEMGTYHNFLTLEAPLALLSTFGQELKWEHMMCLDSVKNFTEPKYYPYNYRDVENFFYLCIFWMFIATIVLVIEKIFHRMFEKFCELLGFENVIEYDHVVRKRFKY